MEFDRGTVHSFKADTSEDGNGEPEPVDEVLRLQWLKIFEE